MNTVIVCGGDGYCGWALSLHLSVKGYRVVIADNQMRRRIDEEVGESLTRLASLEERLRVWNSLEDSVFLQGGKTSIDVKRGEVVYEHVDIAKDAEEFDELVKKYQPIAIVHMAEIRAAPYSMIDAKHARMTVDNNCTTTHNIVSSIAHYAPSCHLVHLGTMGVYGYGAIKGATIPEGYVDVVWEGKTIKIPHPFYPGSVYHTTKTQDALMLQFYAKNYKVRVTDLHQGIVWGVHTDETRLHPALVNRFDYDGEYGTVLNRFCVQGAFGLPLTVYGSGGQTRGLIHIRDSVQCVAHAIATPPEPPTDGTQFWPRVINQITQTETVGNLANLVKEVIGESCVIASVDNPRKELRDNELIVDNATVRSWGIDKPTHLLKDAVADIIAVAQEHRDRFNPDQVASKARW